MGRIEKTVFISYRRADAPWALAVFGDLTQHGYDVFVDYDGIASGQFDTIIFENIRARAHFLVLLTPTALERCSDPNDWLRREIEAAIDNKRNIVPLMLEDFDFRTPTITNQLPAKLATLKEYNGLRIPEDYFSPAMDRLRTKFLNVPVDAVLEKASALAQQVAAEQKDKAARAVPDNWHDELPPKAAQAKAQKKFDERAAKKPFIGYYMLGAICATIALSLGDAYTTWLGMSNFLPWQIAIFFSCALQFLVFLLAWFVAHAAFYRRTRDVLIYGAPYLIAACFSVAFSYPVLSDRLTGPEVRKEANARFGRALADRALSDIDMALEAVSERERGDLNESYETWRRNAQQVIDLAQQSAGTIEKSIVAKRDSARAALTDLENRFFTGEQTVSRAKGEMDVAVDQVNRLEPIVKSARETYERGNDDLMQLKAESDKLTMAMKHEETSGGARAVSGAGRGPIWRKLKDDYDGLQPALFQKKQEVDRARSTLEAREKELNGARAVRDKRQKESVDAKNTLSAIEPELKSARDVATISAVDGGRVEDVGRQFREFLTQFEKKRSAGDLEKAQAACQLLLQASREANLPRPVDPLSCEEQTLTTGLKTLQAAEKRQTEFREVCLTKLRSEGASGETFMQIAEFVRTCIRLSALPTNQPLGEFGSVRGLQETLTDQQTLRPDDKADAALRSKFGIYLLPLTEGQPHAYAAMTFAIGTELLLLMVAFAGFSMQAQEAAER
jgi:hypothetical protein